MPAAAPPPAARPAPAGPRAFRWTREEYYRLGTFGFFDGKRVERIHGEIIEMSPIGWPHVVGVTKATQVLGRAFTGMGWVSAQHPLPADDSDPQSDVAVFPGRIEDYADHPTNPLVVVEVADTTLDRDTTVKAELYASAGFADYWVLDLENRRLLVFRDPYPIPPGGHTYRTRLTFGPADSVTPLAAPAAAVRVTDLLP